MPDCSTLSPSSTPETSLVLTSYWLLCSSACSILTSAQSPRQALGLIASDGLIKPHGFNSVNPGRASIVFAASLAISVYFKQNRVLTGISASVSHPCYNYCITYTPIILYIKIRTCVSKIARAPLGMKIS